MPRSPRGTSPRINGGVLRAVALASRRVMRSPREPASTRAEIARRDQKRQDAAVAAATAEYRRLSPSARYNPLAVSGEVNRMITAAINVDPKWFWQDRMRDDRPCSFVVFPLVAAGITGDQPGVLVCQSSVAQMPAEASVTPPKPAVAAEALCSPSAVRARRGRDGAVG